MVAAPVVAYAASSGHSHGPPVASSDSPSATSDPVSPGPSAPASGTVPAAPDGRIPADQLRNSTLQIPAWPKGFDDGCPTGPVKFTNGKAYGLESTRASTAHVDVDQQETVVLVSCSPQGSDYEVVVLDRDTTGKVVTLGEVVGSAGNTGKNGSDIMTIWGVEAGDNGQVRVDVGEYRPCCSMAQASQHQWRTYGWDGKRFTQTGGPTTFGPNPNVTDLVVTADRLTMTKQADCSWSGTLRVTIHNAAAFAIPGKLQFELDIDPSWQAQPGTECRFTPGDTPLSCTLPSIGAGANRVLSIQLNAPAGSLSTHCVVYADAIDANHAAYPDRKSGVTSATVQVVEG